jgi:hypothetical protein
LVQNPLDLISRRDERGDLAEERIIHPRVFSSEDWPIADVLRHLFRQPWQASTLSDLARSLGLQVVCAF